MRWWGVWHRCQDIVPHLYQRLLGGVAHIDPGENGAQCLGIATRYYVVRRLWQLRDKNGDTAGERRHHPWLPPRLWYLVSVWHLSR